MDAKDIRNLQEAYSEVYYSQELDEAREASHDPEGYEERQRRSDRRSSRERRMNDPHTGINSPAFHEFMKQQMDGKKKKKVSEEVDIFDTILEYLVVEGYADTNQAALAIMANMSEDWRQSILEAGFPDVKGDLGGANPIDPATGKSKYKIVRNSKTGKSVEIETPNFGKLKGV